MTDERDAILGSQLEELSLPDHPINSENHSQHSEIYPQGVIPMPSEMESSAYEDDPHVYVNLTAIENKKMWDDIDRRPLPPAPGGGSVPIRILPSGWQEFKSPGGRTYYYHPELKICQWKPPRSTKYPTHNQQQSGKLSSCSETESFKEEDSVGGSKIVQKQQTTTFPVENSATVSSEERLYCEVPQEPLPQKPSVSMMTNSIDSGLGRSSISYKNHGFGMPKSSLDVMSESVCTFEGSQIDHPVTSRDNSFLLHQNFASVAVKKGNLEKMRISDNGIKTKRREWVPAYAYLSSGHLLFYKDQKRAEKCGKHYSAPTDVCDLRGAKLHYVDPNIFKDKRRHRIIDLIMANNTEYWFSCAGNDTEVESWYNMLVQTITSLPSAKAYPSAILPGIENGSLQRQPSDSYQNHPLSLVKSTQLRNSQKGKLKTPSKDSYDFNGESGPTKDSIIERLLKFFRYRPSVEQLRERGIYRPEPIFGSTLVAICQHDRTNVPRFITEITKVIEERGLHVDGIYRVSGNLSSIQKIRCQVDQDRYDILWKEDDIHVLTGALKLFFRELSEPIFPISLNKEFMAAIRQTNIKTKVSTIDELLGKLHIIHKDTLRVLLGHLLRVATQSDKNRMTIHSLAIMFGPALFSTEDKPARNTNTVDKKTIKKNRKNANETETSSEPNQILAYKMIVFGQIVEFLLKEFNKFSSFIPNPKGDNSNP